MNASVQEMGVQKLFTPRTLLFRSPPETGIEKFNLESNFFAHIHKRFSVITLQDFTTIAYPFYHLCDAKYGGSTVELYNYQAAPAGSFFGRLSLEQEALIWPHPMLGSEESDKQSVFQLESVNPDSNLFHIVPGFRWIVRPRNEDKRFSYGIIDCWPSNPKEIWMYAQPPMTPSGKGLDMSLITSLYQQMSHILEDLPNHTFSVGLGIDAHEKGRARVFGS